MLAQDTGIRGISGAGYGQDNSEQWRQIIAQVEASLCRSDVYRQALDQLQQMAAENGATTQFLLKSVIRETIRLAVKTAALSGQGAAPCGTDAAEADRAEANMAALLKASEPSQELTPEQQEALEDDKTFAAIAHVLKPSDKPAPRKRERKPTPEELAQQAAIARIDRLQKACAQIKQAREAQGLSLHHLHARTFIPLYHLQALDVGQIDHLPADIYLRGFLHRLEKALNLPANSLTEAVPLPEPVCTVGAPSSAPTAAGFAKGAGLPLQSLPLYLTYGAVLAGGMVWLSNQSQPQTSLAPLQIDVPKAHPAPQVESNKTPDAKVSQTKAQLTQKIAAPEMR
jgi:cytoskeleton protein RodZ